MPRNSAGLVAFFELDSLSFDHATERPRQLNACQAVDASEAGLSGRMAAPEKYSAA